MSGSARPTVWEKANIGLVNPTYFITTIHHSRITIHELTRFFDPYGSQNDEKNYNRSSPLTPHPSRKIEILRARQMAPHPQNNNNQKLLSEERQKEQGHYYEEKIWILKK